MFVMANIGSCECVVRKAICSLMTGINESSNDDKYMCSSEVKCIILLLYLATEYYVS